MLGSCLEGMTAGTVYDTAPCPLINLAETIGPSSDNIFNTAKKERNRSVSDTAHFLLQYYSDEVPVLPTT